MLVRSKASASPRCVIRNPPLSTTNAVVASLRRRNSPRIKSSAWMSSSRSWGKVAMSCVLRRGLVDVFVEQHARDHVERLEHAFAAMRGGAEGRYLHFAVVEQKLEVLDRGGVGQVAFVELQHVGNLVEI